VVVFTAFSIGALHALAPDHWVPFVMIGKAQKWRIFRLLWITALAGLGHTFSSFLLGALGILLGISLQQVNLWESARGNIASLLLIGFGLAYMVWGMKHWGKKHSHSYKTGINVSYWTLFALVVFGPCEPLIPLLFLAYIYGWHAVYITFIIFTLATVGMMLVEVTLASLGLSFVSLRRIEQFADVLAGGIIAGTGILVHFLGL